MENKNFDQELQTVALVEKKKRWRIFQIFGACIAIPPLLYYFIFGSGLVFLIIAVIIGVISGFVICGKPPWAPGAEEKNKEYKRKARVASEALKNNSRAVAIVSFSVIFLCVLYWVWLAVW